MNFISRLFGRKSYRPKGDNRFYLELNGKKLPVHPRYDEMCVGCDTDSDRFLTDQELEYLADDITFKIDRQRYIEETKHALTCTPLKELADYPSFAQVQSQVEQLAAQYPQIAHAVSLGKSHEDRDIPALRLGSAAEGANPAVVFSGGTHGREWPSVAIPLHLAQRMLEDYGKDPDATRRLDRGEIWIVPVVNPDGYEYSRSTDAMWRKNRRPGGGVDLNRNFHDERQPELYRPAGDTPEKTYDDKGASDNPSYRQYRGPHGASEPEVQALQKLLFKGNVVRALDNHNCGEMLLYASQGDPRVYEPLAQAMNRAMGRNYKIMRADQLYPVSGTSNDIQNARGIVGMTIESGLSFQPPREQLEALKYPMERAHLAFLDERLASLAA